jgi:cobyrinic acid a,c-diamide synthase
LPRRHLGLVQALEHPDLDERIDAAARIVADRLDLDLVLRLARPPSVTSVVSETALLPPLGQRIAVAADRAFAFAYPAVLEGWRRSGSEIRFFSPLHDEPPAADADAVYLPGGYPELEAGRLAANAAFLEGLRAAAARGAAIFGECGGYMVLGRGLVDAEGRRHAMAGLLPVETSFAQRRLHLGYRRIRSLAPSPLGRAGQAFRGHEFHYASLLAEGDRPLFRAEDSAGGDLGALGCVEGRVAGSFIHLIDREPEITPPAGLESRGRSS